MSVTAAALGDVRAANVEALAADGRREQRNLLALTVPALTIVALLLIVPVGWLFLLSFTGEQGAFSLEHYQRLLHPVYRKVLNTTFSLSGLVTGICVLLGYPLAYLMSQASALGVVLLVVTLGILWSMNKVFRIDRVLGSG